MADPLGIAAQLLSPAFAKVAGAPDIDPVVRTSDHADAQANGALDVARRLGRDPRQVAGGDARHDRCQPGGVTGGRRARFHQRHLPRPVP
ncbi:hypothetical protein [Mycobacterium sp. PSTR-4-N]|uniref:hypothetical protein n=1 Tax=Mycobacteriaceae TaxID=1762 RepID=UPI000DA147D8|nr:hypothetical protein [Mycobacteriaceae bacterium]QVI27194.1 hypothetical protein MN2019_23710 [Mycolicibacterium neoaurum]